MRILFHGMAFLLVIFGSVLSASRADRYVVPIKNDVSAYAHNPMAADEKPVFIAKPGQWLMTLDSRGDMLNVTDMQGNTGWIDKSSVKPNKPGEPVSFSDVDVRGYLDNPAPILILDASNPVGNSSMFERSFSTELSENVDRMTIERIVGKNTGKW